MNDELKKICKKDVDEIFGFINPYLPGFNIFDLNQSVIYEKQRTIICKTIRNKSDEIIGKQIIIKLFDFGEAYILKDEGNSLTIEKMYSNIKEKATISINDNILNRSFKYIESDSKSYIEESYDLHYKSEYYKYINSDSIENNLNVLRNKNKTRKRI